jgi:hypothetical protein
MQVGNLYKIRTDIAHRSFSEWRGKVALYVGESVINRDDGVTIINHVFLLSGVRRVADSSFLKCLEAINESR